MARDSTKAQPGDEGSEISRALDRGDRFVLVQDGLPVANLVPIDGHRFLPAEEAIAAFRRGSAVDLEELRSDLDEGADPSPTIQPD